MNDTFGQGQQPTHGQIGERAAYHNGFRGPVIKNHTEGPSYSNTQLRASSRIQFAKLSGPEARTALTQILEHDTAALYEQHIPLLDKMTQAGTRNSAVNISWGSSKAAATQGLYGLAAKAWEGGSPQKRSGAKATLANFSRAFLLDEARLLHSDPKVHAPERQKLQQSLVDFSSDVMNRSPVVARSRTRFEKSVADFEARKNSVVVSAGNEGRVLEDMAARNHGLGVRVPGDFFRSVLDVGGVTSVGATRFFSNGGRLEERRAKYSNPDPGVDIYASGSLGLQDPNSADEYGTSFAAPRVAATMAELHQQHPRLTSSQVESLMKNALTHNLDSDMGSLQVLDQAKSYRFLRTGTY